ncbi:hypothetical protein QQF64_019270 [Cirrhinus molitorella]|uniref:Uncharacterized protein n=1 Tax=Cirrhinus molitorella TaxID=172907 RepID=A0ABR3LIB3_9TELE
MWIIILLLDGDYVACGMTDWNGVYVFDNQLNRSWCKPTEDIQNETALKDLTRLYIHQSQLSGYVLISIFSIVAVVLVGIYDCCTKLLSYCRRPAEFQRVGQNTRPPQRQSGETEFVSPNALGNAPPLQL